MEIPKLAAQHRSALFTVRLWQEDLGKGPGEVRMQVKHVLSSEIYYFREWAELVEYLERKLQEPHQA